ncbi:MAG: hypothetical protein ACFFCZ_11385 [Promethearchaeota archaeon]
MQEQFTVSSADVYTDYVSHAATCVPTCVFGLLVGIGIDINTQTYIEVFDDYSTGKWRVRQDLAFVGVIAGGVFGLGFALLYVGSPYQVDPSDNFSF